MLLATILLLLPLAQSSQDVANAVVESLPVNDARSSSPSPISAPEPKVKPDSKIAGDAVEPGPALGVRPVKPAFTRPRETSRQRVAWYALAFTSHSAAAFDAWSTRRAVSGGYGTEGNPLLRPFSHSRTLYIATQASPVLMDYIGKRMMVSENPWLRKLWWLPQAAGSGVSIAAGVHNVGVVH